MREMHSRASSYLRPDSEQVRYAEDKSSNSCLNRDKPPGKSLPHDDKTEEIKRESDDSSLILIILMILISQGGADDKFFARSRFICFFKLKLKCSIIVK